MILKYSLIDLEEQRILGRISDDMYYYLKMREVAGNYQEQHRLMHLQMLEKRVKAQKEKEKVQQQAREKKEQEKAMQTAIEKELPELVEKEIFKSIEKVFKKK